MEMNFRQALALFISGGILLASCSGAEEKREIKEKVPVKVTIGIAGKTENNVVHVSGKLESTETAVISTRLMGFITGIKVRPGDRVTKGQLLVTISNADILARRAQAEAMVNEAEAALNDARKDYDRYTELYKLESASAKEYENVALHYNSVKSKAEAARQMRREAEAMLAYSNITAPFAGVVTQRNADEGSMANPGMPIIVIENSEGYQVNTFVSEKDIARIKNGAPAEIVVKSTGRKIDGTVSEVSPSSQMNGGQYVVKVRVNEGDRDGLYAGMYTHVGIAASESVSAEEDRLLVPREAVVQRDQLNGLYTVSEGKTALLRWVTIGKTYGEQVEILSGLNENESFILNAEGRLYNGVPVTVKEMPLSENR